MDFIFGAVITFLWAIYSAFQDIYVHKQLKMRTFIYSINKQLVFKYLLIWIHFIHF